MLCNILLHPRLAALLFGWLISKALFLSYLILSDYINLGSVWLGVYIEVDGMDNPRWIEDG